MGPAGYQGTQGRNTASVRSVSQIRKLVGHVTSVNEAPTVRQELDWELENTTVNGIFLILTFMGPFTPFLSFLLSLVLTQIGLCHITLLYLGSFIYKM